MDAQSNAAFLAAADYIRRSIATDTKRAQGTDEEIRRQAQYFHEWAAKNRRIIPVGSFSRLQCVSSHTSEHIVYFDLETRRAIKQTLPGEFGWVPKLDNDRWNLGVATPLEYLRRWYLFNRVFEDNVQLEGVAVWEGPGTPHGGEARSISVIISQRWRHAADINHALPSEQEMVMLLQRMGFEAIQDSFGGWRRKRDGVVLLDAYPDNFIKTKEGVAPIDLPLTQV